MVSHHSGNFSWQHEVGLGERRVFCKQLATNINSLTLHTQLQTREHLTFQNTTFPPSNLRCAYFYFKFNSASVVQFWFCNYQFGGVHFETKSSVGFRKLLDVLLLCSGTVTIPPSKTHCQGTTSATRILLPYSLSPEVSSGVTWRSGWYLEIRTINP